MTKRTNKQNLSRKSKVVNLSRKSKVVNRIRADNPMTKRTNKDIKTLHRKLKIKQHESH